MARSSAKLAVVVSGTPPQEPPPPVLTGARVTLSEPERHAWSDVRAAFERVKPTFENTFTTDIKRADAPGDLDRLIAAAVALREAL